MLGVGIDWAEDFHLVALGSPGEGVISVLVSRRHGPARKKDDAEDARICGLLALDRHAGLKQPPSYAT